MPGVGRTHMLNISKFQPASVPDGKVCLIVGKRGSGKSVLLKDLLYYKQHFPAGVVMSGTEEGNGYFREWVPDVFVYNQFEEGVIQNVIDRQKELCKVNKARPVFIVLDDCLYEKGILRKDSMRAVFMNGRHWKISLWCTAQYLMDVPPDIRQQIDYVFAFNDINLNNLKKLHLNFFGIFTFQDFRSVMEECTKGRRCLVLNNSSSSNDLSDTVFWYKAKLRNFRMGSDYMWRFHVNNYNPDHDSRGGGGKGLVVLQGRR
jgi:energy-coupling factor transporter ATP-binding protein EcfA2